jgi:hypothetical protein
MSYGHAHSLILSPADTPADKLVKITEKLRKWAVLNAGLMPLYRELSDTVNEVCEMKRKDNSEEKPGKVYSSHQPDKGDEICPSCDEPFDPRYGHKCVPEDERPVNRGA